MDGNRYEDCMRRCTTLPCPVAKGRSPGSLTDGVRTDKPGADGLSPWVRAKRNEYAQCPSR